MDNKALCLHQLDSLTNSLDEEVQELIKQSELYRNMIYTAVEYNDVLCNFVLVIDELRNKDNEAFSINYKAKIDNLVHSYFRDKLKFIQKYQVNQTDSAAKNKEIETSVRNEIGI